MISWRDPLLRWFPSFLVASGLLLGVGLPSSRAQVRTTITPDGTLGTTVTQRGTLHTITGGRRPDNGPNLFHSFDRFSVGTGETASFTSQQSGIRNIVSRVTGGQQSDIDGQLRTDGQLRAEGAHLYLLNPSGVLFGPNASLDVPGSFHVSTADYLRLADGARFYARLSETSTLSVAPPAAFGFLGPMPAPLTVQGSTLQVPRGETIALVGGAITLTGNVEETAVNVPAAMPTLGAPEGRIHLVSVASAGEVAAPLMGPPLDLEVGAVARLDRLDLSRGALVDVSTQGEGPAGRVTVAARDVRLENGHMRARTTSSGAGGEIRVRAGTVASIQGTRIDVSTTSSGTGGEIGVQADTVAFTQGTRIDVSTTDGAGRGGRVTVAARDVRLDAARISGTSKTSNKSGAGGEVTVQAGTLTLTNGATIDVSSLDKGPAGRVTVAASEAIVMVGGPDSPRGDPNPSVIASNTLGSGDAGQVVVSAPAVRLENSRIQAIVDERGTGGGGVVEVQAGTLTLTGGARISASSFGAGQPGRVTVTATEAIRIAESSEISGRNEGNGTGNAQVVVTAPTVRLETGAQIRANAGATSKGGDIEVQVGTLMLTGGARINSSTPGESPGGNVTVTASEAILIVGLPSVRTDGRPSGFVATTAGQGQGGDITVQAPRVELTEGAMISAASTGPGNAGNMTLTVGDTLQMQGHSIVTTTASQATGGNIRVTASSVVRLQNSQITATVGGGAGDGGNVAIDPDFIILQGSQITAKAFEGTGGRISLTATKAFLADPSSVVTASSTKGINGEVAIQAPVTSISGAVAPLPQSFAQTAELLRSRCAERLREGTVSRFIVGGRDGVPLEPGSLLLSPMERVDQEGEVHVGERESHPLETQPGQTWSAQAPTLGELEVVCARWMGKPGTPGTPKRSR
jgi:filamentous hemagglutinin family protein